MIKYIMSEPVINIEMKEDMKEIPFFMIITKPNKHKIQTKIITESAKNLDDIKKKLLYIIQEELSVYFQRNAREICLGAMVSVTVVRVTPDLSLARVYLSIFAGPSKEEVLESVNVNSKKIRGEVGKRLKNMRKIPELIFKIDDSLDYAMEIQNLLNQK